MPLDPTSAEVEQARWFANEVQPHEATLRGYIKRRFPAVGDADDIVQESYLRLWHERAAKPVFFAKAFLFKVARHLAIDLSRRRAIFPVDVVRDLAGLDVIQDGPSLVATVSMQEKMRLLALAIDALPARCREIVILRKLQSLSQKEVAAQLRLSEKTVEAQLARGIKRCELFLRKRGVHHCYGDESP